MVNIYLVKPNGLVVLSCDNMVSQLQKNFSLITQTICFLNSKYGMSRDSFAVFYIYM